MADGVCCSAKVIDGMNHLKSTNISLMQNTSNILLSSSNKQHSFSTQLDDANTSFYIHIIQHIERRAGNTASLHSEHHIRIILVSYLYRRRSRGRWRSMFHSLRKMASRLRQWLQNQCQIRKQNEEHTWSNCREWSFCGFPFLCILDITCWQIKPPTSWMAMCRHSLYFASSANPIHLATNPKEIPILLKFSKCSQCHSS